jgi:hypothetical protein
MEIVNPNSSTVKSTEEIIAKQIEEIKKMISLHDDDDSPAEEEKTGMKIIQINPAMKRHWELEIKTLREAPRDQDKLSKLLEEKHRQWEDTMKIDEIERLLTEMEMLRFVLCAVSRDRREKDSILPKNHLSIRL